MPKMVLLHHCCPRYQVFLEKWVVPGLKQKHTRSLRGSERKESNEKQVTERSVEEAPDQQTNQFLDYIFTNVSKDMRKGLEWISSIKKKK